MRRVVKHNWLKTNEHPNYSNHLTRDNDHRRSSVLRARGSELGDKLGANFLRLSVI